MKTLGITTSIAVVALMFSAAPVFAAGKGTPQNHHCMKDGSELAGKTRKQCKKEGGTWEKNAPAAAAKPAADTAAPSN
jgi:hypothetical protein